MEGAADFADFVDLLAFAPVAVYPVRSKVICAESIGCRILFLLLPPSFLMNCFLFMFERFKVEDDLSSDMSMNEIYVCMQHND